MISLLSKIYEAITNKRNKNFDNGRYEIHKVDVPVISVGNLSVGGTGKTPFVIYLANYISSQGKKVGVIGRGYGRKSKDYVEVSNGFNVNLDTDECGDEMVLIAKNSDAIVISGQKKWKSAEILTNKYDLDVLIVDDGFQHRHLHRDLDILLIDSDTLNKPFVLPKGRLRESFENYDRADIIALKGDLAFSDKRKITINYTNAPQELEVILDITAKPTFTLLSSIAKPTIFYKLVTDQGIKYTSEISFKDHHRYSKNNIIGICNAACKADSNSILTTEKDVVKLLKYKSIFEDRKIGIYSLPIRTNIYKNESLILNKINELIK